ncbi:RidA family protein [Seonamhaeicola sp. ML3]|uniref:RidA family protein n=1 Tax=Seonamhaeicola sp. ML3 TaxID=2937786 RepID=UPI00200ED2CA|nr:Rid family hydrolase [Seonamhaeicola sp. ML3]
MNSSKLFKALMIVIFSINFCTGQETEKQALAKLSFMMGNWSGTSTEYSVKNTTRVKVQESVNYILGGNAIAIDVTSSSLDLHTIITYSVKDSCFYYQPFNKTGAGKYKGKFVDGKFLVTFNPKNKLTFEKTKKGEFHEYGETLIKGKWIKYFEDILMPAPSNNYTPVKKNKITREHIDPITALTNVVAIDHENHKTIYIAGQVGTGKTKEMQLETAYKAIEKRLAQAGATFADLVEMKIYIVDYDPDKDLDMFFKVRKKLYGNIKMPPNVFIGISSLYSKEKLIELSGTAIVIK